MTHSPFCQSPDAYDANDLPVFVEPVREAILAIMQPGSGSTEARYPPLTVEVLAHRLDLVLTDFSDDHSKTVRSSMRRLPTAMRPPSSLVSSQCPRR